MNHPINKPRFIAVGLSVIFAMALYGAEAPASADGISNLLPDSLAKARQILGLQGGTVEQGTEPNSYILAFTPRTPDSDFARQSNWLLNPPLNLTGVKSVEIKLQILEGGDSLNVGFYLLFDKERKISSASMYAIPSQKIGAEKTSLQFDITPLAGRVSLEEVYGMCLGFDVKQPVKILISKVALVR